MATNNPADFSVSFTIRAPLDVVMEIAEAIKRGEYPNRSRAWIILAKMGLMVSKVKPKIDDPEYKKMLKEFFKKNTLLDHLKTIDSTQLQGVADAVEFEKDRRENERI